MEPQPSTPPAEPILLDARGLICPLPVLRARKLLLGMPVGATLVVLATDRAALRDMPEFAASAGHGLIETSEAEGVLRFVLRAKVP